MAAALINAGLIVLGSLAGILLNTRLSEKCARAVNTGLALCVMLIGMSGALKTQDILCVIVCMAAGTFLGETAGIEAGVERAGEALRRRVGKLGNEKFTEGFLTGTLLFCTGSMAIVGSMEAGINHDYSTIISKSVIDGIAAMTFAASLGIGVAFSGLAVLLYQGSITLVAMLAGPFLPAAVVTEMSAVGGLLIFAIGVNMLGFTAGENRLRVGNMVPAVFLPIVYLPLAAWIGGLFA